MAFFSKKIPLINEADQAEIVEVIRQAEARTTGEIRIFVESHCSYVDALDRAKEIFVKLKMANTERRNAVLIYLALRDHQFALLGDDAIYAAGGGPVFWEAAALQLKEQLKNGNLVLGFEACVSMLGKALATHFPYDPAVDKNELPDEIVFGQ